MDTTCKIITLQIMETSDKPVVHEQHKAKLLQQRLKIQKEHERMFGRHFQNNFMKYINECFLNADCEVERVYDIYTTRFTSDTYYQNMRYNLFFQGL